MSTKTPQPIQHYEKYWQLTLETSDIFGVQFNTSLKMIVEKIDFLTSIGKTMDSYSYQKLQKDLETIFNKVDLASIRKGINQFLKLGFINNGLESYHPLTKVFLSETDRNKKKLIFSKIVYENASFNRSFKNPANDNEVSFLVKTLEECKIITKDQMLGLISTKISDYPKGFLTVKELNENTALALANDFDKRKYNQRNYIFGLCKNLTDVYWSRTAISINDDLDKEHELTHGRDPYLQRLYKEELKEEVMSTYGEIVCCLMKIPFPILIASHIKPYHLCSPVEQFDKNNGLLLSRDFDGYFDSGKVSFDDDGNILFGPSVDPRVVEIYKDYKLDPVFYTAKRKAYMKYHRELFHFSD